jgi:hypothetical protein
MRHPFHPLLGSLQQGRPQSPWSRTTRVTGYKQACGCNFSQGSSVSVILVKPQQRSGLKCFPANRSHLRAQACCLNTNEGGCLPEDSEVTQRRRDLSFLTIQTRNETLSGDVLRPIRPRVVQAAIVKGKCPRKHRFVGFPAISDRTKLRRKCTS